MTTQASPPGTDPPDQDAPVARPPSWSPPGFRRGRTGPRILAGITYFLLGWGALRTIGHPVALLFFAAGTGLAIAIWHDYRGLRSRLFAKPGRPWVTSGGLATVGLLAWIIAFGQDNPGGSASGPVADPILQASHAEATALLGEARIKRDAGEFGLALELALQAQAKWPSSAEVKTYLAETGIQATAGMKSAVAQATVAAKAASAQATTEAKAVADADAKEKAAVAETARQARVVADFEAGTANRTAFVDTINKVAPTAGVFIQGANLSNANLLGANLSNANLSNANLTGADLDSANLTEADLSSANLTGADLRYANLTEANLSNANLLGANLSGANLSGANLSGADFTGAYLTNAVRRPGISHSDMDGVKGLDTAVGLVD